MRYSLYFCFERLIILLRRRFWKKRTFGVERWLKFRLKFIKSFLILRVMYFFSSSIVIIIHCMIIEFKSWDNSLVNKRFNKWWRLSSMLTKIIFICRISNKISLKHFRMLLFMNNCVNTVMPNIIRIVCWPAVKRWPFIFRCPKIHCYTRKVIHFLPWHKIFAIKRFIGILGIFSHHILIIRGIIFH